MHAQRLRVALTLLGLSAIASQGFAQSGPPDLTQMSIEDLMNIEITSVSHKAERAGDAAAAISVITQEDIRRSGMTTIPELLRLVPGVQVAQINSNKWAVSVRGFNNLLDDKLLVLVDGRTVYDRLNAGVFWESLDIPLDDIDRIEVIRGPGGATWGANAINGAINIVTKSAAATQGIAVNAGGGTLDGARVGAQYGGTVGRFAYRVSSQWSDHGETMLDAKTPANDGWQSQTHGVRLDWTGGRDAVLVEGGVMLGTLRALFRPPSGPVPAVAPPWNDVSDTHDYNILGRWTHSLANGASLQTQSSVNYHRNDDPVTPTQVQADIDMQYHAVIGRRHDVVVGAGYRDADENVKGGYALSITPSHIDESVINVFTQDEITLGRRVQLTLGAKVERDSHVGWGVQPTARVMWTVAPKQHVWAAISKARRTPTLSDLSGRYNFTSFIGPGGLPVVVGALGNPAFQAEDVIDTEGGYRIEVGSTASIDATVFVARYDNLKTSEPLAPRLEATPAPEHLLVAVQFHNLLQATTSGVEFGAHWIPTKWWRLDGGCSTFHLTPHLSASSHDATAASFDGSAPDRQWQARSAFSMAHGVEWDVALFHVAALATLNIGAYTRADTRLQVPLTKRLTLSVVGQNLLDPRHAEFAGAGAIVTPTLIPRSASVNLVWRSRS